MTLKRTWNLPSSFTIECRDPNDREGPAYNRLPEKRLTPRLVECQVDSGTVVNQRVASQKRKKRNMMKGKIAWRVSSPFIATPRSTDTIVGTLMVLS
jgi:hypothetical protein